MNSLSRASKASATARAAALACSPSSPSTTTTKLLSRTGKASLKSSKSWRNSASPEIIRDGLVSTSSVHVATMRLAAASAT
jgi:hypothetical protein